MEVKKNDIQTKEFDLLELVFLCLKYKGWLILISLISLAISYGLFHYLTNKTILVDQKASANILIEDDESYTIKELIDILNIRLSSSYNYEKWSNNNSNLDKTLTQENAIKFTVNNNQILNFIYNLENTLAASTSYINYTTEIVSEKINKMQKKIQHENINNEKNNINIQKKEVKNKLETIKVKQRKLRVEQKAKEEEVFDRMNKIEIAKENVVFLESYSQKIKEKSSTVEFNLTLTILSKKNAIVENQFIVDRIKNHENNLMNRELSELNTQYDLLDQELAELDEQFKKLDKTSLELKNSKSNINKNIIKVGRLMKHKTLIYNSKNNFKYLIIFPIFIFIGLILGIAFFIFKEDYNYRKNLRQ